MFWIILCAFVGISVGILLYFNGEDVGFIAAGVFSSFCVFTVSMIVSGLLMAFVPTATKTEIKTYEVISDTIFCDTVRYIDEENVIRDCSKFKRVISDDGTFYEVVTTSPNNGFWILPFLTSNECTLYLDSSLFERGESNGTD